MFLYSLRFYAHAKFENIEFWVTSIVDKLHIKLILEVNLRSFGGEMEVLSGSYLLYIDYTYKMIGLDTRYAIL